MRAFWKPHVEELRKVPFDRDAVYEDITQTGKLLGKFLSDFNVEGENQIRIVTFYQDDSSHSDSAERGVRELTASGKKASEAFSLNQSFLGVLELVGTLSPIDLWIAAELFVKVPVVGRVRVDGVKGGLAEGASAEAKINVILAKGKVTLTAQSNSEGRHDLMIEASAEISLVGTVTTGDRPFKLLTLPTPLFQTDSESLRAVFVELFQHSDEPVSRIQSGIGTLDFPTYCGMGAPARSAQSGACKELYAFGALYLIEVSTFVMWLLEMSLSSGSSVIEAQCEGFKGLLKSIHEIMLPREKQES
ncbi:hypothetical protein C8J56DRAFT_883566 [Mycena floridula]|nr:hypothetical protein C8J56DRAFT_883566 [Mycena floridula]